MKRILVHFWLLLGVLVACKPASTTLTSRIPADIVSTSGCPDAKPGTHQLVAPAQGFCFLYPESYNAVQGEDSTITLYVRSSMLNHVPLASIRYTPAEGQTLETITAQRISDYAWPETQPQSITVGGEAAVMLDNLPGQDTNRRVVAVHNDKVYDLVIHGIGDNYGTAGELAEELYNTVVDSIQFIEIDPDAPMVAGPECPEIKEKSVLYTNEPFGYCLLLPADYSAINIDTEGAEEAFYVESVQDTTHARLFIKVTDANGRTLENVTADREAEIEKEVYGSDVMWSWGALVDGEPANEFRMVPGQQLSRQIVTLHNGRVYTFTFFPDGPETDKTYTEMQNLFEMVMDSFSFLWQV